MLFLYHIFVIKTIHLPFIQSNSNKSNVYMHFNLKMITLKEGNFILRRQKTGILLILLLGMLCTPLIASTPSVFSYTKAEANNQSTVTDIPRNIRIAVYNDSSYSVPSYTAGAAGTVGNNATGMVAILQQGGYDAELIDAHDISEHQLITANYDVFVLVDNFPLDNITDLVWDFWKGGGGILALDGSALYLCYMGILPPEAAGTTGQGTYWNYNGYGFALTTLHPISKSYEIPSTIPTTGSGYLLWNWIALSASSIASDLVRIATSTTFPTSASIIGYDAESGGKVASIGYDLHEEVLPALNQMFIDTVNWLTLRPKGRIAFDYTHAPRLGVDSHDNNTIFPGYFDQMRDLWVSRDYSFDKLYPTTEGNLTAARINMYDILILVSPDYNYTASEVTALQQFVANGGSLFIMGDDPLLSTFAKSNEQFNRILQPFDMYINATGSFGNTQTFTQDHDEPILEGTSSGLEMTFAGFINFTGNGATPLFTNGEGAAVASQEYQHGRVVVCTDMNWATDAYIADNANAQFLINIANWLSAARAQILLFVNEVFSNNYYVTPVAMALNDLDLKYYLTFTNTYLNMSLKEGDWGLVVIDAPWSGFIGCYSTILQYIQNGGRFIMSGFQVDAYPTDPLWAQLGFKFAAEQPNHSDLFIWQPSTSIFNNPNHYNANNFTPVGDYGDEGDLLNVTTGVALAGYSESQTVGNATIVLGASGKTLYNGYLIDEFSGDNDLSAYPDNFELWENEIAFMMRPMLTHPTDINMVEGDTVAIHWYWQPTGVYSYQLKMNGTSQSTGQTGEYATDGFAFSLSTLTPGTYQYEFSLTDHVGFSDSDTVVVYVSASTSTTTTTGTGGPINMALILAALVVAIVVVVIILIASRRKKPSK